MPLNAGPQVSVIIPFYNAEKYLRRSVDSITGQTYRELEILLVDDGSEDSSPAIADALAGEDARIRVIRPPHGGVSAARNAGLKEASGEYILFMDSDDWMDSDIVGQMVDQMTRQDADLVTCDIRFSDGKNVDDAKNTENGDPAVEICSRDEYLRLFFKIDSNENVHFPVAKLYKKALLPETLYPVGIRVGEDVVGTHRALAGVKRIVRIRKAGYYYYNNPESVTTSFSPKDFDLLSVWDQVIADTQGHEPEQGYAKINRNRVNFTLLFRIITEVPAKERHEKYEPQIESLRAELQKCRKELLSSPIVLSRKILIVLLCRCYPLMSAAGNIYVQTSRFFGKMPGLTRRKQL